MCVCVCVCARVCVRGAREGDVCFWCCAGNKTDDHEYIIMFIVIKRSGLQGKCLRMRIIQDKHSNFQDSGRKIAKNQLITLFICACIV